MSTTVKEFKNYINKLNKYYKTHTKNINYNTIFNLPINNNINALNIYFQNISTIKNKLTIVEIIIEELKNNFVIIALSETKKVDSNIIIRFKKDWEIEIVNPKLNKCGGLIILIKKGIIYKIQEQYYINEISVDEMWLKITKMIIQI
jgi:hypothetical protein